MTLEANRGWTAIRPIGVNLPGCASGKSDSCLPTVVPAKTGPQFVLCTDRKDWMAKQLRCIF